MRKINLPVEQIKPKGRKREAPMPGVMAARLRTRLDYAFDFVNSSRAEFNKQQLSLTMTAGEWEEIYELLHAQNAAILKRLAAADKRKRKARKEAKRLRQIESEVDEMWPDVHGLTAFRSKVSRQIVADYLDYRRASEFRDVSLSLPDEDLMELEDDMPPKKSRKRKEPIT